MTVPVAQSKHTWAVQRIRDILWNDGIGSLDPQAIWGTETIEEIVLVFEEIGLRPMKKTEWKPLKPEKEPKEPKEAKGGRVLLSLESEGVYFTADPNVVVKVLDSRADAVPSDMAGWSDLVSKQIVEDRCLISFDKKVQNAFSGIKAV